MGKLRVPRILNLDVLLDPGILQLKWLESNNWIRFGRWRWRGGGKSHPDTKSFISTSFQVNKPGMVFYSAVKMFGVLSGFHFRV